MISFILASHNKHKVDEVLKILDGLDVTLQSLSQVGFSDEIIEDGETMKENAWIKARYVYNLKGGHVMADDSGLEVFALNGAPGIHSARYAGPQRNDEDNIDKLLAALKDKKDRSAQFRSVIAVILDGLEYTFEGIIKGHIDFSRTGNGGFGYDPIFIPENFSKSFAVLPDQIKNTISHRARALGLFKEFMSDQLSKRKR